MNWNTIWISNDKWESPLPAPERAIYGFALYLGSYVCLALYLVWAYIPQSWLYTVGLTYLPHKYWALAIPILSFAAILLAYLTFMAINFVITLPLCSINTITDKHAVVSVSAVKNLSAGAVPPLSDTHISEVCKELYLWSVI